ncbi:hypothetical protein [Photobacterium satsumensis]|uniref:hypothetical protein n=1 Tax=Photobacterium satsumensis TaxID=2910239 RepID=UPI003D0FEDCF
MIERACAYLKRKAYTHKASTQPCVYKPGDDKHLARLKSLLSVADIELGIEAAQWEVLGNRCLLIREGEQTLKVKYGETPAEAYLLQREALWLNRLNTLELANSKCINFSKNGQQSFLFTNYLAGLSASQWLRSQLEQSLGQDKASPDCQKNTPQIPNQLKPESSYRLAIYLESALDHIQAIHRHDLVHGDIKPGNMIFGTGNIASLIDFSNMRRVGEPWQERGFQQFSPSYIHPSQFTVATKEQDYYAYLLSVVALFDASQIPCCKTVSGLMKVINENTSKWHLPDLFNQQLLKLL